MHSCWNMNSLASLTIAAALIALLGPATGAETIQAGVAAVEITPTEPIRLSGYRLRREPATEIAGKLWVKALAIGDDEQGPAVILTADLVGVPLALTNRVAERLGLGRECLVVCASHTHSAPFVQGVLPNIFGEPIPDDHAEVIARYAEALEEKMVAVAKQALANRRASRLSRARGKADFAHNRRVAYLLRQFGKKSNPPAPVDRDLPAMFVHDAETGELRAVFLSYACHCTTLNWKLNQIHGDWAGVAARIIQERHPGVTALVAIGCGADQNPHPRGKIEHVEQYGAEIADEVGRLLESRAQPLTSPPKCSFAFAKLPFAELSRDALARRLESPDQRVRYYAKILTERKKRGIEPPAAFDYPVQTWSFGNDLAMVFLAGEVVVDYSLRLKREIGPGRVWVHAYCNDAPCYIASARVIGEGGYEAQTSMDSYDKPNHLDPIAEERIIQKVHDLLPKSFQSPPK